MSSKYEKFEDVDTGSIDHDLYPVNQTTLSSQSDLTDTVEIIINPLSSSTVSQPTASNSVASNHSDWKVTTNGDVEHKVHSLSSPARSSELPIKSSQSNYETYQEYPEDEEQLSPLQKRLRHRLEHVVFRVLSLLLILIDCTILIAQLANPFLTDSEQKLFDTISAMFAVYFCIEITLRIFARGITNFFSDWYNSVDFVIIFLSMVVVIVSTLIDIYGSLKLITLGRLIRVFILIRLLRAFYIEPRNVRRGMRNMVSENKRRIRLGRFDLDLTYICSDIIAMSFPSTGRMAWYRNNIRDVAAYLDERHGAGRYRVYNLCSERAYETRYFHAQVARYEIDDHNVPTLAAMLAFCRDAHQFLSESPDNVIAVHCKGGKGRTGTMICALLLYLGRHLAAEQALLAFSDRRTDSSLASKFQGVETPSQARYVGYFAEWLQQTVATNRPPTAPTMVAIGPRVLHLSQLRLTALIGVGQGDGSDLTCRIEVDRREQFSMDFGASMNCSVEYKGEQDALYVHPINCPPLVGDVRVRFYSRSRKVPVGYDACAFYFWFNTAFIPTDQNRLRLTRTELDNPHKSNTWKVFRERFAVDLEFETSPLSVQSSRV